MSDYKKSEELIGEKGIMKEFQKVMIESILDAEMTHQLGYEKYYLKGKRQEIPGM